ncbi:MAG: histidinol dehydrogenase [Oscillospiraceae bacterium]|nr:histidinol dehydrogenase [Oscillospiraceae bacterium]
MKILNYKDITDADVLISNIEFDDGITAQVSAMLKAVKEGGDKALLDYYSKKFGRVVDTLEVTADEIASAWEAVDPALVESMKLASKNIEEYHAHQLRSDFSMKRDGVILGQKYTPMARAGLYVPGGTAPLPSSVLMNAIPAKIAGVGEIIMATPSGKDGTVAPAILVAAQIAGVHRIFKVAGANAIAAMAFGTETIPQVDVIAGPGNIYVTVAKKLVYGIVGIDMLAGPSEILIIADASANPRHVAADFLSQAEHDTLSTAILLTTSENLAKAVAKEIEVQLDNLPRSEIARKSVADNGKTIITETIEEAVELSNKIAPEHLELCVDDPFALLPLVKNAGSIFMGNNTPEAAGDYFAGTNHVLPTSGTARFSSPLSVDVFVKKSSYLYYTPEALKVEGPHIVRFAEEEQLDAHANSVRFRLGE